METLTIPELERLAEEKLSKKRFKHVVNVKNQAVSLGKKYKENLEKCQIAALLHDITKELTFDNQLQMILQSDIMSNDIIIKSAQLYHAVTGTIYTKETLHIEDEDILNAIKYHTTARANMSKLEKIIYIADATSADRKYKEVERFRELSFVDLDLCMLEIIRHTIRYLVKDGCLIPADTLNAYNELTMKQKRI